MAYDTLERKIKRFLGDRKRFSDIIFSVGNTTSPTTYIIDYASRVGIVPKNKKKVREILGNYDNYSIAESISRICHYFLDASTSANITSSPLCMQIGSASSTLNDHNFQEVIGEDLTLFLKLFVQECHAYILGLKDTLITKCPKCGAVFVKSENRQKYCTPTCRNNYRTEKYRRKHKKQCQ